MIEEQPTLQPIAKEIAKIFRREHLDYDQARYIFKIVRKELGLKARKTRGKSTVKRISQEDRENFIGSAYKMGSHIGLMMETLY